MILIDNMRHIICVPYSIDNLHRMAEELGIKRCWFHKNHYDAPKRMHAQLLERFGTTCPRVIMAFINEHNDKHPHAELFNRIRQEWAASQEGLH